MAANLAREAATVGLRWTARLAGAAAAQRMVFVDAPVSGSQLRHSLTNPSTEVPTAMSTATIAAATRAVRALRLPGSEPR